MARNYTDDPTASTTLSGTYDSDVNSTLTVTSSAGFPAVPFYAAIKRGLADQQVVEVTGVAGTTWTVTPVSGSTVTHGDGSPVEHVVPAIHFNTVGAHIDATTAHGSGSAIVGKDQSVTLTGKTMSGLSNTFSNIPQSAVTSLTTVTTYTPTLTQSATVTKTVVYASYVRVGNWVEGRAELAVTGTGTASNGVIIGLPVAASANGTTLTGIGTGAIYDASANLYYQGALMLATGSANTCWILPGAGTNAALGGAQFTAALANTDRVSIFFSYEAAP